MKAKTRLRVDAVLLQIMSTTCGCLAIISLFYGAVHLAEPELFVLWVAAFLVFTLHWRMFRTERAQ